jgi:hypothetical protein
VSEHVSEKLILEGADELARSPTVLGFARSPTVLGLARSPIILGLDKRSDLIGTNSALQSDITKNSLASPLEPCNHSSQTAAALSSSSDIPDKQQDVPSNGIGDRRQVTPPGQSAPSI